MIKKILITAGPTHEPIDPVRFIGNNSSGKMGIALADAFAEKNYRVYLVLGPTHHQPNNKNIDIYNVTTADEMYRKCLEVFEFCDCLIMTAAVADFKPETKSVLKIKKENFNGEFSLKLVPTTDILKSLGERKNNKQIIVGFSLETNNEITNATEKMKRKNCDLMIMNSLQDKGAGFGFDTNKVTLIGIDGNSLPLPLMKKTELAEYIVKYIEDKYFARFMSE